MKMFLIDPEKCTGCRDCEIVCSLTHENVINPYRSRIVVIRDPLNAIELPTVCVHCEDPVCMDVCPVSAIYEDPNTGAKLIDYDKCMGCRSCVLACPFGGALVDPVTGKTIKCDLCNGDPMCVKFCKTKAIDWVEVKEADQRIKKKSIDRYLEAIRQVKR